MSSSVRQAFSWLHAHPELSGGEVETARFAARFLRDCGWSVRTGVGGHGVVARLGNGDGPHVAFRAELDALPHRDSGGVVMARHTCGHDMHLACVLAAARRFAQTRDWSGTLTVIGQPAEETLTGAADMLADDVYREGAPDVLLAQHTAPLPTGYVAHTAGPVFAGGRVLQVRIRAAGGHAAGAGHISPLVTAAAIIGRLQSVVAGETGPAEPAVINVGSLEAADPPGVIPAEVSFQVSLRAMNGAGLDRLEDATRRVVVAEAQASGHPGYPVVTRLATAVPVVNPADLARVVSAAHRASLGNAAVLRWVPSMATEDFPTLARVGADDEIPSYYWILGCVDRQTWSRTSGDIASRLAALPGNHSPDFRVDPAALDVGVEAMVSAVRAALADRGAAEGELRRVS